MKIKRSVTVALLGACLLACGCSGSKEMSPASSRSNAGSLMVQMQSGTYTARIGDMVEVSVMGYPEFHTSSTVDQSGDIMIPQVGNIHAAGLTKPQIEDAARKKLSAIVRGEPEITIGLFSQASQKITVIGAVTKQDNIAATGKMTILQVLSSAGGPTPESDLSHVRIIHNGNTGDVSDIDLTSYLESGNAEGLPVVESGDVIYVPKKENVVRIFSDFLRDAVFLFGTFRLLY